MSSLLIKICGIRDPLLATQTVQAGAHFIGIVFYPSSKRCVDLHQAKTISEAVKKAGGIPVAVFVNHSALEMQTICELTGIDTIQLHGHNSRAQHYLLPLDYQRIYVQSVTKTGFVLNNLDKNFQHCDPERDFLLFDSLEPGSGKSFDWKQFCYLHSIPKHFRFFLSGGLNVNNIKKAVNQIKPTGVDVSSGVETDKGEKNINLIQQFLENIPSPQGERNI